MTVPRKSLRLHHAILGECADISYQGHYYTEKDSAEQTKIRRSNLNLLHWREPPTSGQEFLSQSVNLDLDSDSDDNLSTDEGSDSGNSHNDESEDTAVEFKKKILIIKTTYMN